MSLAQRRGISPEGMGERGSNSFFIYLFELKKFQFVTCLLNFDGLSDSQPSIDRGIGGIILNARFPGRFLI